MDLLFGREPTAIREYFGTRWFPVIICGGVGVAASVVANIASRRPAISGIQKHFILAAAGGFVGNWYYYWRKRRLAEKEAMLRHYIELHPEDFIEPPKRKYKDIFEPWIPVR